jgi:putative ubiquitin-RnfH superfamily antitoxin RatB of RatAB toxin-antitoxin module
MDRAEAGIDVELLFSPAPRQVERHALSLPAGATVADALQAAGLAQRHGAAVEALAVGVWGRVVERGTALRHGDRVELYRPLTVDPKEARRLRYRRQGERGRRPRGVSGSPPR